MKEILESYEMKIDENKTWYVEEMDKQKLGST